MGRGELPESSEENHELEDEKRRTSVRRTKHGRRSRRSSEASRYSNEKRRQKMRMK